MSEVEMAMQVDITKLLKVGWNASSLILECACGWSRTVVGETNQCSLAGLLELQVHTHWAPEPKPAPYRVVD